MPTATLTPDGSKIAVYTSYQEKEKIQIIPGIRRSAMGSRWELPLSWASCVILRGVFGAELTVEASLTAWAWKTHRDRIAPVLALKEAVDYPEGDPRLRTYQRAGVAWLLAVGSGLLADDMGSGKTVQITQALSTLGAQALPALVICPNSVKRVWARHVEEWHSDARPYVLTGTLAQRRKELRAAADDDHAVVIVNIEAQRTFSRLAPFPSVSLRTCRECDPHGGEEGLTASRCHKHPKELNAIGFRTVIADEAHYMQSPQSQQTRATWALMHAPTVTRRWALTATPVGTDVAGLWPIGHGVAPEDYPGKTKWLDRYAEYAYSAFGNPEICGLKAEHRDEFYQILDTRMRRMPKALILPDLPPIVRVQRYVQMTPKQAKAYSELASRMITRMDDGSLMIMGDNLIKHLRLLQLSSSYGEFEKDDPDDPSTWTIRLREPSPKIDELMAILESMEPTRQVAACAVSSQLIDLAAARLEAADIAFGKITGAVNEAERTYQLDRFQRGDSRVLLFTTGAGGTGLTMTAADTLVCMQRSYRMIENIQTEGRVHRIGSERHDSVTIIDLVTEGTVEETDQIPRLLMKLERLEEINRDRERLRAAGLDMTALDTAESEIHSSLL